MPPEARPNGRRRGFRAASGHDRGRFTARTNLRMGRPGAFRAAAARASAAMEYPSPTSRGRAQRFRLLDEPLVAARGTNDPTGNRDALLRLRLESRSGADAPPRAGASRGRARVAEGPPARVPAVLRRVGWGAGRAAARPRGNGVGHGLR